MKMMTAMQKAAVIPEGEISSVISTNECASCKFCNCKVSSEDKIVRQCSKCNAVFKMSKCGVTIAAKVIITDEKGKGSSCDDI